MVFDEDLKDITRSEFANDVQILENVQGQSEPTIYEVKGIFEESYVQLEEDGIGVLVKSPRLSLTLVDKPMLWEKMKANLSSFLIRHEDTDYKVKADFNDDGLGMIVLYLEK